MSSGGAGLLAAASAMLAGRNKRYRSVGRARSSEPNNTSRVNILLLSSMSGSWDREPLLWLAHLIVVVPLTTTDASRHQY